MSGKEIVYQETVVMEYRAFIDANNEINVDGSTGTRLKSVSNDVFNLDGAPLSEGEGESVNWIKEDL